MTDFSRFLLKKNSEADPIPSPFIVPQKILTPADLFKWGYQIAFGMEHIAKKKVRIHKETSAEERKSYFKNYNLFNYR